jgi:hypothetical protein
MGKFGHRDAGDILQEENSGQYLPLCSSVSSVVKKLQHTTEDTEGHRETLG